jgi:hypothetical protein
MSMLRSLASAVVLTATLGAGFAAARLTGDPHTATAEPLAGTVTWSNEGTRLFVVDVDGQPPDPSDGDPVFQLATDDWTDPNGTIRAEGSYPECLAGTPGEPVTTDRHRIALEVIHRGYDGPHRTHLAVAVHCLPE